MTKLIAMYLPQFHEIPENNKWWGKGHTEWTSCKKAKQYFKNQYQPKVPLDENYYNLLDKEVQRWQSKIALENNIYGFCYYHYWFEGKKLLEKPAENMLNDKEIKINFCFSWANHSWTNSVSRLDSKTLIQQTYGDEKDWEEHIKYLMPFFKDERYIKIQNKPVFVIYDLKMITNFEGMKKTFDNEAKKNGFDGIYYISTLKEEKDINNKNVELVDAQFEYQPRFSLGITKKINYSFYYNYKRFLHKTYLNRICVTSYDLVWKLIFKRTPKNIKTFLGAYTNWDTTARWNNRGEYHKGYSPEKFKKYFTKQYTRAKERNDEFLFITAWNEWSEGAYLEPDEKYGYQILNSIKEVTTNDSK